MINYIEEDYISDDDDNTIQIPQNNEFNFFFTKDEDGGKFAARGYIS